MFLFFWGGVFPPISTPRFRPRNPGVRWVVSTIATEVPSSYLPLRVGEVVTVESLQNLGILWFFSFRFFSDSTKDVPYNLYICSIYVYIYVWQGSSNVTIFFLGGICLCFACFLFSLGDSLRIRSALNSPWNSPPFKGQDFCLIFSNHLKKIVVGSLFSRASCQFKGGQIFCRFFQPETQISGMAGAMEGKWSAGLSAGHGDMGNGGGCGGCLEDHARTCFGG